MRYPLLALPFVLVAALTLVSSMLHAQPTAPAGEAVRSPASAPSHQMRLHPEMLKAMDDMALQMNRMQERLDNGALTPEARADTVSSMKKMAAMMYRMAGLLHRPSSNEPEAIKQLETMRTQMEQMQQAPQATARPQPATAAQGAEAARSLRPEYEMARLLRDMANEMQRMQDQMSAGQLTPKLRSDNASRMEQMSDMMRRLSGLTARSAMKDADMRRQLEKMQAQMAHMRESPQMSGVAKRSNR